MSMCDRTDYILRPQRFAMSTDADERSILRYMKVTIELCERCACAVASGDEFRLAFLHRAIESRRQNQAELARCLGQKKTVIE